MRFLLLIPFSMVFLLAFAPPETSFFSQLTEKSSPWKMEVKSSGCFHYSIQQFEVFYQDGQVYLNYQEKWPMDKAGRKIGVSLKLNEAQLKILAHFEKALRGQSFSKGCTTITDYQLTFGEQSFAVSDGSCDWEGLYELVKGLKLQD